MRILLIEDEKILRVSLDKSLTKAGYIVEAMNTDIYNIETDSACYKYTDCNN